MDRDLLERCLAAGLSLPEIGRLVGRHPSTVGYWVQKHGLAANGKEKYAPGGGLTREQLERLVVSGASIREIAEILDRSQGTIRHWIKRHQLPHPAEVRREAIRAALANGSRTIHRRCKRHGETEFALVGSDRRPRCKRCRAEAVARRRRKVKRILVEERGGRCQLCGYDRSIAALEFHHVDPATKSFGLAHRGITRSLEEVRREADKCALLCGNCHAEVEAGVRTVPLEFS
jgi:transposase